VIAEAGECFEEVELWNEPNNLSDWDWRLDPGWTVFAAMVRGAAGVARAAGKRIVLGGMCPIDPSWLQRMGELGVLELVDVVGVHGFPGTWDVEWTDWRSSLTGAQHVLNGSPRTIELWITETAYSTWRHDERGQIDALLRAIDAPVGRVYWSALQDLDPNASHRDGFHVDERHYHLGLVRADNTPKLAYRLWAGGGIDALRTATAWARRNHSRRSRPVTVITGGAGFVGTNLAERLLERDHQVLLYDNLSRDGVEQNLQSLCARFPTVDVQVADVRDKYKIARALRSAQHVFHLAAQVAVTTSLVQPVLDFEVNAGGTVNVLEAIRGRTTPPTFIYTSTNKVYGNLEDVGLEQHATRYDPGDSSVKACGISESRKLDFHSPYGCSKGTADQYVLDYARSYGLPALVFRMSCIYGPHQCGNEDQGWVAHFVANALAGKPLTIYGDGRQVRDVLFVSDLVDAFLLARDNVSGLAGRAFNIGGGPVNTTSLLELVALLEPLAGRRLKVTFDDWRIGDQRYYVSDPNAFMRATGWRPSVGVQEGVTRLAQWFMTSGRLSAVQAMAS
jgi:CDP-paratose 2-epimerase